MNMVTGIKRSKKISPDNNSTRSMLNHFAASATGLLIRRNEILGKSLSL